MVPGGVPLYPPSRANPRISGSADGLYRDLVPAHPERFLRLSPPAQRGGVDPPRGRPVGAGPHGTGGPAARAWSGNGRRGTDGGGACDGGTAHLHIQCTETDATAFLSQKEKDASAQATPLKRIGLPDDVAGAILFLSSEEARFISGAYLPVSGGMHMT